MRSRPFDRPILATLVVTLACTAASATPRLPAPTVVAAAATTPTTTTSTTARDDRLIKRYQAARLRRNIGWGLSGIGLASLTAGAVLLGTALTEDCNPSCYDTVILPRFLVGASLLALGLATSIPGLVLALQGQGEMTEVRWRLGGAAGAAWILPQRDGLLVGAVLRF